MVSKKNFPSILVLVIFSVNHYLFTVDFNSDSNFTIRIGVLIENKNIKKECFSNEGKVVQIKNQGNSIRKIKTKVCKLMLPSPKKGRKEK